MPQRAHTTQPAPAPLRASTHTHHRLFLGPLPSDSEGPSKANTARVKRYRALLNRDLGRPSDDGDDAGLVQAGHMGALGSFPGLRRRRRSSASQTLAAEASAAPFFIIGHEFRSARKVDEHGTGPTPPIVLINPDIVRSGVNTSPDSNAAQREPPRPVSRPSIYPRSTMDRASFRTARETPVETPNTLAPSKTASKSIATPGTPFTARTGTTDFFSAKSTLSPVDDLVSVQDEESQEAPETDAASHEAIIDGASPLVMSPTRLDVSATSPRFRTKLRSALRKKTSTSAAQDIPPLPLPADDTKGKRRTVQFPTEAASREPAPPREVLARTGSAVQGTSAGVVEAARSKQVKGAKEDGVSSSVVPAKDSGEAGEDQEEMVSLRDRILVAVGKNTHPNLSGYDEAQARRKPSERIKAIEEYLVVYRKGWVELYKEWSTPIGRTFRKSKRLCFAIPLVANVTQFSVFSRRDLSFALCLDTVTMRDEIRKIEQADAQHPSSSDTQTISSRRNILGRMKQTKEFRWIQEQTRGGKNRSLVFVFMGRERTRMLDWCWQLWSELGGQIPEQLRVQVPVFDSIIDLPRPSGERTATLRAFSRSQILLDVFTALRAQLPDYDDLVARERERSGGNEPLRLELAWEADMHLDWIPPFAEWSVENARRDWAVLAGLSMIQLNDPCELLLLPIKHDANDLKLADGMRLNEPPAIEGFLHRLTGLKGAPIKRRVFVHTQAGYLLSMSPQKAQTPLASYHEVVDDEQIRDAYFADERIRNTRNMLHSDGLVDFRSIARIEPPKGSGLSPFERPGQTDEDQLLEEVAVRSTLARLAESQFAVILDSKEVIWLQASDPAVALEWFTRVGELCKYWSHRQRVDARDRMDLIREMNTSIHTAGAIDSELARDTLTCRIANWCPFERCNTILHCGRLYIKPSSSEQFRESFCILVPGFLMECSVTAAAYHKRKYTYSLAETYVFSGYLAQAQLHDRLRVDDPMETRLYQDGLSSSDGVEDCSFVVWIRREETIRPEVDSTDADAEAANKPAAIPRLAKRAAKMVICRARCQLERDLWVRALSIEIESHSREHAVHQNRLRRGGNISA